MSKSVVIRCFLVSFVISVFAALLSTTVLVAPEEGAMVPDLSTVDNNDLAIASYDKAEEMIRNMPMRELTGLERFTYPMTHPQYISTIFGVVFTWFLGLFIATITVSYLNAKRGVRPT